MEPSLASIYKPVQAELQQVEESLLHISRNGLPEMPQLLKTPLRVAGKRLRPALTLLAGKFFEYNLDLLIPMAISVELFHTATLVHDDIVDRARLRRGMSTTNRLYGQGNAVLLGDFLFARSAEMVCSTGDIRVVSLFAHTLGIISSGELRQSLSPPEARRTRQHYLEWIGNKTAALFRLATESGAILSQTPPGGTQGLSQYGWYIGLAFQIVDDILDFVGEEAELGKPVGADLLQGMLTLPVILLAERYPQDETLRQALEVRDDGEGVKRVAEMLGNSPIMDECYSLALSYSTQALAALSSLPSCPALYSLHDLADYVLQRKK